MRKSRFTEEQILFALKQGDGGQPVADMCRQMGISEATHNNWKKRYGNLGLLEVRELGNDATRTPGRTAWRPF